MNTSRAFVFIDGSNFYFKLKDLIPKVNSRSLINFKFHEFAKGLVRPNELSGVRYYIGAIKQQRGNDKSEKLYADQQRLISKLQQQGIHITLGHLIQHPDKTFHEKGVDVRLAVEMIRLARQDEYDIAYLVSSDTDLIAAVEEVQSFGKRACYVGSDKGWSYGLSKTADFSKSIKLEELYGWY